MRGLPSMRDAFPVGGPPHVSIQQNRAWGCCLQRDFPVAVRTSYRVIREASLFSGIKRSEIVGIVAGFGTTFADVIPDLIAMFKRRSRVEINPRMAAIMCVFQVLWVYYGLLITSRPVVIWNVIAVVVNFLSVGAYFYFVNPKKRLIDSQEQRAPESGAGFGNGHNCRALPASRLVKKRQTKMKSAQKKNEVSNATKS